MLQTIKKKLKSSLLGELLRRQEIEMMLLGRMHAERVKSLDSLPSLAKAEFRVFSQNGEDGIIQYLTSKMEIPNKTFIEIGIQNYVESNTRFLLLNDNWHGLVADGSEENIAFVKADPIYWKHDLTALSRFVTKENVNGLVEECVRDEDLGLLSIDIDGNDYWVWKEIERVRPRIVICEYNSLFGKERAVTVPYDPRFFRTKAHYSNLYFGASIPALCLLAEKKGYDFVGSDSAGVNAFFVRKDLSAPFKKFSAREGYVEAKTRESRNSAGELTFLSRKAAFQEIAGMELVDVESGKPVLVREILA